MAAPLNTGTSCFREQLPAFNTNPKPYTHSGNSSESTKKIDPPKAFLWKPVATMIARANIALGDGRVINSSRTRDHLATPYTEFPLNNESEVVHASIMHVIEPIMEILNILYPQQWTFKPEMRNRGGTIRCDLVFLTSTAHTKKGKKIATLEFKRRGTVEARDWENAILPHGSTAKQIQLLIGKAHGGDLLDRNASPFIQQLSNYAKSNESPYAALFNWEHLLLFNFNDMNGEHLGDSAEISWVIERPQGGPKPFVEIDVMRKVLLGWLVTAYEAQNLHR